MGGKIGTMSIRNLAGFFLLGVMLLAGFLVSWQMGRLHSELSGQLEDSAWLALSGQWENARSTAEAAKEEWEKNRSFRAAFADHTPMEEIDDLFGELKIYGAAGERTEFARTCAALSGRMEAMGNAHRLTWWNVL